MRAARVGLLLLSGCLCGPMEASPPGPAAGPAADLDGGTTRDAGAVDSGPAFTDAGPIDLDAGDCGCAVGALLIGCGQSQCEGGQLFDCQADAGLRIDESACSDAGRPLECGEPTCRCDVQYFENTTINVPCCIVVCQLSSGLGRTCTADGGQAEFSCR